MIDSQDTLFTKIVARRKALQRSRLSVSDGRLGARGLVEKYNDFRVHYSQMVGYRPVYSAPSYSLFPKFKSGVNR